MERRAACHATTSPQGISANWIHYLEKTIRGAMGADVIVVFLQGTSGDVTQVDLPSGTTSGLRVVQEILDGVEDVHFAQLSSAERSTTMTSQPG